MSNTEIIFIMNAIRKIVDHYTDWLKDYDYNKKVNEFQLKGQKEQTTQIIEQWFDLA